MKRASRYHPLLVTLHWLLALLLLASLGGGFFLLGDMPSTDPRKIGLLKIHMAAGMLILLLMVIRFIVRVSTARPAPASTGVPAVDRWVPAGHVAMYVLVVLMAATGFATALLAGLPDIVFAASGQPLPKDFHVFATRVAHGWIASILAIAIIAHVLAALYHQFVRRDGLLRRMGFGRRRVEDTSATR